MRFGKSASGSTPFTTSTISNAVPTTFISTRSNIGWCCRQPRGRFPQCIDMFVPACWLGIGAALALLITPISVSAGTNPDCDALHPGYRFALIRRFRSPDGAQRNPGADCQQTPTSVSGGIDPDFASLRPGYRFALIRRFRSPDGAQRNPGADCQQTPTSVSGGIDPDFASLRPGYRFALIRRFRSPDGAQRNPGADCQQTPTSVSGGIDPDFASLRPGY